MKLIQLTQGKSTIVDNEDFNFLNQWKWYLNSSGYAVRDIVRKNKKECILMHRFLNNTPVGFFTDHINRDRLDNRKENLRTVTASQNLHNRPAQRNNTSGIKGVSWHKGAKKWRAWIQIERKPIHLGLYKDKTDAILARTYAEESYAGV